MDGTLIESTNADFLAWQKVFLDYGKNLTFNDYSPLLGKRSVAVVKDLLKITAEEDQAEFEHNGRGLRDGDCAAPRGLRRRRR